jgi:hypothetical protein
MSAGYETRSIVGPHQLDDANPCPRCKSLRTLPGPAYQPHDFRCCDCGKGFTVKVAS